MTIEINSNLNRNLIAANFINLYARIVINSDYSRHSFADRSIFTIYEKIQSRLIKGIGGS